MIKLLEYIRSISFAVLICLIAMSSQAFHTFYSFWKVSSIKDKDGLYDFTFFLGVIQVLLFLTAFESFTLFYLMRGKINMAKFYAGCLCIMNLYYYWINLSGLELALGMFISIIIPVSIFNVAEIIKEDYDAQKAILKEVDIPEELSIKFADKFQVIEDQVLSIKESFETFIASRKPIRKKKSITINQ